MERGNYGRFVSETPARTIDSETLERASERTNARANERTTITCELCFPEGHQGGREGFFIRGQRGIANPQSPRQIDLCNASRTPDFQGDDKVDGEIKLLTDENKNKGWVMTIKGEAKQGWKKIEAAVDSGATDAVADPAEFPGVEIEETEESKRGEEWTCAAGSSIPKLGRMKVDFWTKEGVRKKMMIKACKVNKTLIGASRLNEAGYDVILNKLNPRLVNLKTKEVIQLRRKNGMYILDMWIQTPWNEAKNTEDDFHRQG